MPAINKTVEKLIDNDLIDNHEKEYFLFHKNRYSYLLKQIDKLGRSNSILDAGCAYGHLLFGVKKLGFSSLFGLDIAGDNSLQAKRLKSEGIKYVCADLSTGIIPCADDSFDVILFFETLEHFNFFPGPVFKEFNRVLKKGGKLMITTPNLTRFNNRIKMIIGKSINNNIKAESSGAHFREYNRSELEHLLTSNNFKINHLEFSDFEYPDQNCWIKLINKIIGVIFPFLRSNIIIVASKI